MNKEKLESIGEHINYLEFQLSDLEGSLEELKYLLRLIEERVEYLEIKILKNI